MWKYEPSDTVLRVKGVRVGEHESVLSAQLYHERVTIDIDMPEEGCSMCHVILGDLSTNLDGFPTCGEGWGMVGNHDDYDGGGKVFFVCPADVTRILSHASDHGWN